MIKQRLLQSTMIGGAALMALAAVPALTLVVAPTSAFAQSQTGTLTIGITGTEGQPLSGATVTVSSPDSLVSKTAVTDASGRARLSGLDPSTNYSVQVVAPGYADFTADDVAVVSGRDLSLRYALGRTTGGATSVADVVVTGRSLAAVDTTSATVSTTLTLETVESLPTGRNYQSYLQLVPGVKPSDGNPSSRSGVNYSDVGGRIGTSTDNVYYLDGVDVTDPATGTFGSNFNSEIIQEQQVIVGGVPAEYAGGSGLISRVVTKSGGNEWHGSLNYYLQNDSLVATDDHNTSGGFSTYDSAFTLGGPILRDRLWIFGSYQKKHREDEVLDGTTGALLRSVTNDAEYSFAKATWQVTNDDRLSVSWFSDPTEISGSSSPTTLNNRDSRQIQGGDNYKVDYSHTWGDLLVNAYWFQHGGEVSRLAADQSVRNTVAYRGPGSTLAQRSLGGAGSNLETHRDREEYGANFEYFLDSSFGTHTIKAGYTNTSNTYGENGTVPGGATFTSIALANSGATFADFTSSVGGWTTRPFAQGDQARIQAAILASPTATAAVDTNLNGIIEASEVDAITFSSTAGNPNGMVNASRNVEAVQGAYQVRSEGQAVYLQDTWTLDQLTINAGLRAEKWEHFASDDSKVATFDWDVAPRLSVVYDLFNDGRSKVFGFAGRYYDPVRNNMSDFAGALTGPVTNEQINVYGEWLTYRVRGGATTPDALFAPTTKTPYTDEYMLGYSTTFGSSIGLSASVTHRATRDILEDFDLALYSDPNATAADGADGYAFPGSPFYIPLSYFGYDTTPNSNYVIGTLPGAKRDYTGFEITLTKYKVDNWFGQVSYTHNAAKGNSNSDSNADFQGDWIALDPRAPNLYAKQPGNIEHQFKAYGAYDFDFGLQVAGVFNWNSGALYTPSQVIYGRYFAPMDAPYEYNGVTDTYLSPGFIGSETTPSYFTLDMRFKYEHQLPIGNAEFFLDVFNILNKQSPTSVQKLLAGDGVYAYQEANDWVAPRRAYLGVRFSF
ncbi:TonB-dependent receptor [uncultured Brevundimonas sp.]|uniref:TonB-dependent receptor n=1 Tax=uncultured Brevundimonas sp. TaxID=213418 RepID=UPI0030EE1597|tara:strand:+ start:42267 stop:45290 length:3024 start_codon:yes stop_codon:yes gene_type:complete